MQLRRILCHPDSVVKGGTYLVAYKADDGQFPQMEHDTEVGSNCQQRGLYSHPTDPVMGQVQHTNRQGNEEMFQLISGSYHNIQQNITYNQITHHTITQKEFKVYIVNMEVVLLLQLGGIAPKRCGSIYYRGYFERSLRFNTLNLFPSTDSAIAIDLVKSTSLLP